MSRSYLQLCLRQTKHLIKPFQREILPMRLHCRHYNKANDAMTKPLLQNNIINSLFHRCPAQNFHTSGQKLIHPIIWVIIKPVAKFGAAITGRTIRVWFKRLAPEERRKLWLKMKQFWYIPVGCCGALAGIGSYYYYSHLEATPITGRQRFIVFTHEQIVKIAEAEAEMLKEKFSGKFFSPMDLPYQRVAQVALKLIAANPELKEIPFESWKIFVVKDPIVNACVLPNGNIFVFEGILKMANTQDQLAIILGHEMAHSVLGHGIEELSYGDIVDVFMIICLAALWLIIPFDGVAMVTHWFYNKVVKLLTRMPHSRQMEREADKVGLQFAAKACYDVREGTVLWQKMSYHEKLSTENQEVLPEFMLTHPDSMKRAEHIDFLFPEAEKWRKEMKCPKLPDADPREAIKILSKEIDNYLLATKTGQDLRRVPQQPSLVIIRPS